MKKQEILLRFGRKVRAERKKLGLSQEDLAARAKIHRTYIGMVERAEKNVTLISIAKLAHALRLEPKDLLT